MNNSVLRYDVPIDGKWHEIKSGWPLHVEARQGSAVEFWALTLGKQWVREYRVFRTGHSIEDEDAVYIGTTFDAVTTVMVCWHLFSRPMK